MMVRAELEAQRIINQGRNTMSEEKQGEPTEESKRLNTVEGQELQAEQNAPVTPEEAEKAHEENQGFGRPPNEKWG